MKTVLCEKDSQRDDLCAECKRKLSTNEITELDASVSRALGRINKHFPISNVAFHRALDLDEFILLVCSGSIGSLIGPKGRIVSDISKSLGKKVRIIEKTKNEKKIIQDLIGNARILGFQKKFVPGSTTATVFVLKWDSQKLSARKETLEAALGKMLLMDTKIEFK